MNLYSGSERWCPTWLSIVSYTFRQISANKTQTSPECKYNVFCMFSSASAQHVTNAGFLYMTDGMRNSAQFLRH